MTDRILHSEDARPRADWWARLFGVCGLAAGAAALYYSWIHTSNLPTAQEIITSYRTDVDQFLKSATDTAIEDLNKKEEAAVRERNHNEWLALQQRDEQVAQRIAKLSILEASAATQLATDSNKTDADAADAAAQLSSDLSSTDTAVAQDDSKEPDPTGSDTLLDTMFETEDLAGTQNARLQLVRRTLRPASAADSEMVTISNTTEADVAVSAVRFVPNSLYEVKSESQEDSTTLETVDVDIQLLPSDNQARDPSKQGTYRHVFAEPATVSAGSRPNLRVQIHNSKHLGWGLRGTLVLIYGEDQLEIPDVSARFVAER